MDLRLAKRRGRVRPTPCGPADVLRRNGVGRASEPAADAAEPVPPGPVLPVHCPAARTGETRVSRVDQRDLDALLSGFVFNEAPKLSKRPRVKVATLGLFSSDSGAYPLEVFQGNPAPSAFGLRDQILGDRMVDVGGEAPLPAAALFALVLGAAGGALNALLITRLSLPPLIVTLGSFSMFRGIAEGITHGAVNYSNFPPRFLYLGQGYLFGAVPVQFPSGRVVRPAPLLPSHRIHFPRCSRLALGPAVELLRVP